MSRWPVRFSGVSRSAPVCDRSDRYLKDSFISVSPKFPSAIHRARWLLLWLFVAIHSSAGPPPYPSRSRRNDRSRWYVGVSDGRFCVAVGRDDLFPIPLFDLLWLFCGAHRSAISFRDTFDGSVNLVLETWFTGTASLDSVPIQLVTRQSPQPRINQINDHLVVVAGAWLTANG